MVYAMENLFDYFGSKEYKITILEEKNRFNGIDLLCNNISGNAAFEVATDIFDKYNFNHIHISTVSGRYNTQPLAINNCSIEAFKKQYDLSFFQIDFFIVDGRPEWWKRVLYPCRKASSFFLGIGPYNNFVTSLYGINIAETSEILRKISHRLSLDNEIDLVVFQQELEGFYRGKKNNKRVTD